MKNKITIIYTTFLRNSLAFNTIQSIQSQLSEDCILLIADQNKNDNRINQNPNWYYTNIYNLPYNCGLSYARNYLVQKAHEMGIQYVLITADSIKFTDKYNFEPIISLLESNPKYAVVGLNLKNRQPWVYDLEISPKHSKFIVIKPRRSPILANNIEFTPCDTVANFFVAKTAILRKSEVQWDNELCLCEHEDFFYRLKQAGYKTFYTDSISAEYINKKPEKYNVMRKRLYGEFKTILKKKYNLDPFGSWLIYNAKLPKDKQL